MHTLLNQVAEKPSGLEHLIPNNEFVGLFPQYLDMYALAPSIEAKSSILNEVELGLSNLRQHGHSGLAKYLGDQFYSELYIHLSNEQPGFENPNFTIN